MVPPCLQFLPHEIMLKILSHLLVTSPPSYFEDPLNGWPSSYNAWDLDPVILQTCSQIYRVGTSLLYSSNGIEFSSADALYRFTGGVNQLVWNTHWVTEFDLSIRVWEPYEVQKWRDWCYDDHLSRFYPSLKKLVIRFPDHNLGRAVPLPPVPATRFPEFVQICNVFAAHLRAPVVRFQEYDYDYYRIDGRIFSQDMERRMSTDIEALQAEHDKEEEAREARRKRNEERS